MVRSEQLSTVPETVQGSNDDTGEESLDDLNRQNQRPVLKLTYVRENDKMYLDRNLVVFVTKL